MERVELRAFFFNAKTDYLPYYLPFTLRLSREATTLDMLKEIRKTDDRFGFDENKPFFRVNGIVIDDIYPLSSLIERFGTSFQVDPLSLYRCTNGLCINQSDFEASWEILAPFAREEDKAYYESLYPLHYASATFEYRHDYIGDAALLCAYKMIRENPESEDAILEAIGETETGVFACEFEQRTFGGEDLTSKIETLKEKIRKKAQGPAAFVSKLLSPKIPAEVLHETIDAPHQKHIALLSGYAPLDIKEKRLIDEESAGIVSFAHHDRKCGVELLPENPELAYEKAARVLLDAIDSGAEVCVVSSPKATAFLQRYRKKIAAAANRDIPVPIVYLPHFIEALQKVEA